MENIVALVESMRANTTHYEECEKEKNLLSKCIKCKRHLSSQQWSGLLEKHIKTLFNIGCRLNNVSGDGNSQIKNCNIEIKVSLGAKDGQMHFVQIRPDHNIDYYIFLGYNLFEGELGELYWFLCKAEELYQLIPEHGGYAHGTIRKLEKITSENVYGRNCEYALRPNPQARPGTKPRKLWDIMLSKFKVSEEIIHETI